MCFCDLYLMVDFILCISSLENGTTIPKRWPNKPIMLKQLFVILFLLRIRLSRSKNAADYLRHKYGGPTLNLYRRLESSSKKWKKAELDHEFLMYCKMNNIVPNFIKFRLYRASLYNSEFYRSSCLSLLDIELNFKTKAHKRIGFSMSTLSGSLYPNLSCLDRLFIKSVIKENVSKYETSVRSIHDRKLLKLGIQQPKFMCPKDVIFNYSSYMLSKREEFLLSLGIDFCLPNFKPSYTKFFLAFESFFNTVRYLPSHINLESARQVIQSIAHKTYASCKTSWFPFFKKEDFQILKQLSQRKDIIVCRPDKGKGTVLLNHEDYVTKMNVVLSDQTKFTEIGQPEFSIIFRLEDKINRTVKQFKDEGMIDELTYQSLYSSGSSYGILYGLPKVHKENVPLRPILAAYNAPNFPIAKFLVPILSDLTMNQYTLQNSTKFIPQILSQDVSSFMVSFDVASLFTNVPLFETIDLILNKLFPTPTSIVHSFDRVAFKKLLELAVVDTHFVFNKKLYKQVDGMAMGSPLGPSFANIFMCFLEEQFLDKCPTHFKPIFYKRYVDDTFVLFRDKSHAALFLNYINNFHANINFSMDTEVDNKLPFLDILVSRSNGNFVTGIFRKNTFTGLGLNFFSHCFNSFKLNACRTLLHRAYSLCSDWNQFHEEISALRTYFRKNCYPAHVFANLTKKFLDNIAHPKLPNYNVPKKLVYVPLPYLGNLTSSVKKNLELSLSDLYPYVKFNFIFTNPLTIGSLFQFKDTLPELMRSGVTYKFSCSKCNFGTYVGCTNRLLKVRIDSHRGVSHRTGIVLNKKEHSSIRSHCFKCKCSVQYDNFKILAQSPNRNTLLLLESLFIKKESPSLNCSSSSIPLQIA